jgi:hypothetical protein
LDVLALVVGRVGVSGLESVEEEAGAAEVDIVGGDTEHDFTEGLLDLCAGVWGSQGKGGVAGTALAESGGRTAGFVMVVAEALAAQGGAAATVLRGAAMMAAARGRRGLVGNMDGFGFVHRGPPVVFLCKVFKKCDLGSDFVYAAG